METKVLTSSFWGPLRQKDGSWLYNLLPLGCSYPSPPPAGWLLTGDHPLRPTSSAFTVSPPRAAAGLNPSFSTSRHRELEQAHVSGPWVPTYRWNPITPACLSPSSLSTHTGPGSPALRSSSSKDKSGRRWEKPFAPREVLSRCEGLVSLL